MGRREAAVRPVSLSARAHCHATESLDRVRSAVRAVLPEDISLTESAISGHFGNPIVVVEGFLDEPRRVCEAVSRFPPEVPARAAPRGGAFLLRLDKSAALEGRLAEGLEDPILVRVAVRAPWGMAPSWEAVLSAAKERCQRAAPPRATAQRGRLKVRKKGERKGDKCKIC